MTRKFWIGVVNGILMSAILWGLLFLLIASLSGCTLVWTDKIFLIDWGKKYDIDKISLISEPNYIEIIAEKVWINPKNIKAKALIGPVPVTVESVD